MQVAARIRERIALGDYGDTGALESEAALASRHATSRVTVRRALEALRDDGLVVSRKGSGWFVARDPIRELLGVLPSATDALVGAGVDVDRRVLEFGFAVPPPPVGRTLALAPDDQALRAKRLHSADGEPYDLITTWLVPRVAGAVSRDELAARGAWATLQSLGAEPVHTFHSITAGAADPAQAALLGLTPGSPVLLLRRVAHDADRRPLAVSYHRFAPHHIRIDIEFHGEPSRAADPPGLRLVDADDLAGDDRAG